MLVQMVSDLTSFECTWLYLLDALQLPSLPSPSSVRIRVTVGGKDRIKTLETLERFWQDQSKGQEAKIACVCSEPFPPSPLFLSQGDCDSALIFCMLGCQTIKEIISQDSQFLLAAPDDSGLWERP